MCVCTCVYTGYMNVHNLYECAQVTYLCVLLQQPEVGLYVCVCGYVCSENVRVSVSMCFKYVFVRVYVGCG